MSLSKKNQANSQKKLAVVGVLLSALVVLPLFLTTCNTPMGFGDAIDWEPPKLYMDPEPNPKYVREGTKLSGSVTDNVIVDRIIVRNVVTGKVYGEIKVGSQSARWELSLAFTPADNGERYACEVVAYDRFGNSGETSIKAITLIVDTEPPLVEDIEIQRTDTRKQRLQPYNDLYTLEGATEDKAGEKSANVNRYQNGWFYVNAKLSDAETRIEGVKLRVFDSRYPSIELLTVEKESNTSAYAPKFLLKEEEILQAGASVLSGQLPNYLSEYNGTPYALGNETNVVAGALPAVPGKRYYYRVEVVATDKSGNQRVADENYFCMWTEGDKPKGVLDPRVGTTIFRGTALPVEFFDDDSLRLAYTGLFKIEQWNNNIYPAAVDEMYLPPITDEEAYTEAINNLKLEWLWDQLVNKNNTSLQMWDGRTDSAIAITPTKVYPGLQKMEDTVSFPVETPNTESAYGEYVLFTLVADKKLDPHNGTGPRDSNKNKINDTAGGTYSNDIGWVGRAYNISIIDENRPLIVFDKAPPDSGASPPKTTGDSPESNTFPLLTGGQYFEINGYTLRAKGKQGGAISTNKVQSFRMAWIPYNIAGGAESWEERVQTALKTNNYSELDAGIQYWDLTLTDAADEIRGGNVYAKQIFRKKFDILGGTDDLAGAISKGTVGSATMGKNFNYVCAATITKDGDPIPTTDPAYGRENEPKLFIFCAVDSLAGKDPVFTRLRLLDNKTPPNLTVYDITGMFTMPTPMPPKFYDYATGVSDDGSGGPNGTLYGGGVPAYQDALKKYVKLTTPNNSYTNMRTVSLNGSGNLILPESTKSEPWRTYPRGTTLGLFVRAEQPVQDGRPGDLAVVSITMDDITDRETGDPVKDGNKKDVGYYNSGDRALTYIETLPEVAQRVLLFTAVDSLGNRAQIQRTVAATSTAQLAKITSSEQSGTYGIGQVITIRAEFTGLVKIPRPAGVIGEAGPKPKLNVRYFRNGAYVDQTNGGQLECTTPYDTNTLYLEYKLSIPVGAVPSASYPLETRHGAMPGGSAFEYNKPIDLNGARILDTVRSQEGEGEMDAFVPSYAGISNWETQANSLQSSRQILLDGTRPTVVSVEVSGKTPVAGTHDYYFKAEETIGFTLTATKGVQPKTGTTPVIQFQIQQPNNGTINATNYEARYVRPEGSSGTAMYFAYTIPTTGVTNIATLPNGTVTNIRLINSTTSSVVDNANNAVSTNATDATEAAAVNLTLEDSARVRIDRSPPPPPEPRINTSATINAKYNDAANTFLSIEAVPAANEPWGVISSYSLNGGLDWFVYRNTTITPSTGGTDVTPGAGKHILITRHTDVAGNTTVGASYPIEINGVFPRLIAVNTVQPHTTYLMGKELRFRLIFESPVRIDTPGNVYITLADRSAAGAAVGNTPAAIGASPLTIRLTGGTLIDPTNIVVNGASFPHSSTIEFVWANTTGKEMTNVHVRNIFITGLHDSFNNTGVNPTSIDAAVNSASVCTINFAAYTCNNLATGLIVDGIIPTLLTDDTDPNYYRKPAHATTTTSAEASSTYNRTIILTFSENVAKGKGSITVQPRGNYAIPAVFENEGYYVNVDTGARFSAYQDGLTRVDGFSDVYNNADLNAINRNTLTQSTTGVTNNTALDTTNPSMSRLRLNLRTGQSAGPYKRMTHGLQSGLGYTGDYLTAGSDAPEPTAGRMVPDTVTKWVLDYRFQINETTGMVGNIRTVLTKAKWRWQEVDVSSANVRIGTVNGAGVFTAASTGNAVQITLPEPLLEGLQWDFVYEGGTFTDVAGNEVAALTANTYWFWSKGVQTPVVRVNRRSFDARGGATNVASANTNQTTGADAWTNSNVWYGTGRAYSVPADTATWNATTAVTDNNGWGIGNFETVHYRIETETPGASVYYGTLQGTTGTGSSVTAAFTGNINGTAWNSTGRTNGTWVQRNLIRRAGNGGATGTAITYTINGVTYRQTGGADYQGFRSYNRDPVLTDLTGVTRGTQLNNTQMQGIFSYAALEARKDYVVAEARFNGYNSSDKTNGGLGYEGVFRSVVAINYAQNGGWFGNVPGAANARVALVEGSNIKNGMPSIAGFPVKDAEETGDNRFVKVYHYTQTGNGNNGIGNYYWVSTEIVSSWYELNFGATHQQTGEVTNYITCGYGDLSYSYNQR